MRFIIKMGRNWNYFKANFKLMWINTIEYKTNLYTSLAILIIYSVIGLLSFILIGDIFDEYIDWEVADFVIFYVLQYFVGIIAGFFSWGKELHYTLTQGNLNQFLTKPLNPFIGYIFHTLTGWQLISAIFRFFLLIAVFIYFKIVPQNILLVILIILLINILVFVIHQFLESLEFIKYKLSSIGDSYWEFTEVFYTNPAPLFQRFPVKTLLYLWEFYYTGLLLVPLIRGYEITNFGIHFYPLVGFIVLFGIGTLINWHYGLKKYEAYN